MKSININRTQLTCWVLVAGVFAGCTSTSPPPLPPGNPADPQVRVPAKPPTNFLAQDDTTVAIQKELIQTESTAKSAESIQHEGMQHEGMKMEEHGETKHGGEIDGHEEMQHGTAAQPEKKAVADEMKKTSDEMKETSDAMKRKSDEMKQTSEAMKQKSAPTNPQGSYYICRMHPQIHSDKPGKCPICGMTLIKKKGTPPK